MIKTDISLREVQQDVADQLQQANLYYGHGTDNANDEAAWLIAGVLQQSPALPLPDVCLTAEQAAEITGLLKRRITDRTPLAYLLNSAWFCGLEFYVDERVIVPRSPFAELIAAEFSPWLEAPPAKILDLCTGSACIAVACTQVFADAVVDASDISAAALAVAEINKDKYALGKRMRLWQADVFTGLPPQKYDLIVSNPPYVDAEDMAASPAEYHNEPELALAAGEDGLTIVNRILQDAVNYLTPKGLLICEVGNSEAALIQAYPQLPFIWLEFEFGGSGVFLLHAEDLK